MEFKGTQGSWHTLSPFNNNDHLLLDKNSFQIGIIQEEFIKDSEIIKANAKLISKSPELLEMVKKLHNLLEEHQPNWYLLGHHREIENLIKEATTI